MKKKAKRKLSNPKWNQAFYVWYAYKKGCRKCAKAVSSIQRSVQFLHDGHKD